MSMLRALAAVGGAAALGFAQGADDVRRRKAEDEDRDWTREQRQRQRKEWSAKDAEREAVADAAQDVVPVQTTDSTDMDSPGAARPASVGYRVGGVTHADEAGASKAAAQLNSEQGKATRMAGALDRHSPERAAQMRASARQSRASELQIGEAERRQASQVFDEGLSQARIKGAEGIAEFLTQSQGDAHAGKAQFKAVVSPDGKSFQLGRVNDDGSLDVRTPLFSNDARGHEQLTLLLSRNVPEAQKIAHFEGVRRFDEELALRKKDSDRRDRAEGRMAAAAERQAVAAERAAGGVGQTPDSTFDSKTATEQAQKRIAAMREERAANNLPPPSAQEEAAELQATINTYRKVHAANYLANTISTSLSRVKGDPDAYAQEYQKAIQLGATAEGLAKLGHVAPAAPAAPVATGAKAQAKPSVAATPRAPADEPAAKSARSLVNEIPGQATGMSPPVASTPPSSISRVMDAAAAKLAPDLNAQADAAIVRKDKALMRWVLEQKDASKPLTNQMRTRLNAALKDD